MKRNAWKQRIAGLLTAALLLGQISPVAYSVDPGADESSSTESVMEQTVTGEPTPDNDSQENAPESEPQENTSEGDSQGTASEGDSQENASESEHQETTPSGETDQNSTETDSMAAESGTSEETDPAGTGTEEPALEENAEEDETLVVETRANSIMLLSEPADATVTRGLNDVIGISGGAISLSDDGLKISSAKGLILLSYVAPENYYDKDIQLTMADTDIDSFDLLSAVEVDGYRWTFQGLGSEACPYQGTMDNSNVSSKPWITNRPIFNAISESTNLSGAIIFQLISSEWDPVNYTETNQPLLAAQVKGAEGSDPKTWTIQLESPYTTDETGNQVLDSGNNHLIGGLIGTMSGAAVNLDVTVDTNVKCQPNGSAGLLCGTMEDLVLPDSTVKQSYLTISGLTGTDKVTVSSATGNAGGLVGSAENSTLTLTAGSFQGTVEADAGHAGGLIGSADNTAISATSFSLDGTKVTAGSGKSAGGLVGYYVDRVDQVLPLTGLNLGNLTINGSYAGGLFGTLRNSANLTITGGTAVSSTFPASTTSSVAGGLIGAYHAGSFQDDTFTEGNLSAELNLANLAPSSLKSNGAYGGVIGTLPSTCYVSISDLEVTVSGSWSAFGGIAANMGENSAVMLDVGNITIIGNQTINGSNQGGLVGLLSQGVLRLHGQTNLNNLTAAPGKDCGKIVGQNGDGLVYATPGWMYSIPGTASNIGNWSEVVRLDGTRLKEGTDGLLSFDATNHTVTINTPAKGEDGSYTLSSVRDFAAYALAFNYDKNDVLEFEEEKKDVNSSAANSKPTVANEYSSDADVAPLAADVSSPDADVTLLDAIAAPFAAVAALLDAVVSPFAAVVDTPNADVDPKTPQTVVITADTGIDLTNTGIIGIGRDNGADRDGNMFPLFEGEFNGGGKTVTLDVGNHTGALWAFQTAQDNNLHGNQGLFARVGDANIHDLTVAGEIKLSVLKTSENKGDADKRANPIRVAGITAYQNGEVTYTNVTSSVTVTVDEEAANSTAYVAQAGFVAHGVGGAANFTNCKWDKVQDGGLTNTRTNDQNFVGGLVGYGDNLTPLTVTNCTLSGSIALDNVTGNAHVGGVAADLTGSTVTLQNLTVSGEKISATGATKTNGGLLGYSWLNTNVTFGGSTEVVGESSEVPLPGVNIVKSSLTGGGTFGGLVYQATGYWNATAAKSIVFGPDPSGSDSTTIKGASTEDAPSGLLVGTGLDVANKKALYLEVGTWGTGGAYQINAVSLKLNGSDADAAPGDCFDELVGTTIQDNAGNGNAVVSLAVRGGDGNPALIDITTCNTYTGQLQHFQNGKSRYYYNLDSYRVGVTASALDTPGKVLSWSASQYAADNISTLFCTDPTAGAVISGLIDLTGYSYYPVSLRGTVSLSGSLCLAYEALESAEASNRLPSDATRQHYLMHYGLLYNVSSNVTVTNTDFSGNVGKTDSNSGALIFGTAAGNTTRVPVITLSNVTLNGLKISGMTADTAHAPLLINKIDSYTTLNVNNLSTGTGYLNADSTASITAATSLIGPVGNSGAVRLNLQFSNIALDSRTGTPDSTSVMNNGDKTVEYKTKGTIFTKATLLESFQYSAESSGTYNFNASDTKVTYGKEISNTSSGRNPAKQYFYYSEHDNYVWDGQGTAPTADTIKTYYLTGYLPYVGVAETANENNFRELDINIPALNLDQGCGTYGNPYQITDGNQLVALARFLTNGSVNGEWMVNIDPNVYASKTQGETSYHTAEAENSGDVLYRCSESTWTAADTSNTDAAAVTSDGVRAYLRNAYYLIYNDITISNNSYSGIGGPYSTASTFSGVIAGKQLEGGSYPTVTIAMTRSSVPTFGGLIQYSQGSVVKDLTVNYSGSQIGMSNDAVTGMDNNRFFGGVVGYCMGGDTIIDNVSVIYGEGSVTLSGNMPRLIAAGGYVGLVGGAKDSSGYEKTGGGVVFRNMESHSNNFVQTLPDAGKESPTLVPDSENYAKDLSTDCTYFFCNRYVGRVLDGYACNEVERFSESFALNNTDKNYTIPDVVPGEGGLSVTKDTNNTFQVTVTSEQGLWLLSAIVNSGAGAMDGNGSYTDDSGTVDAYQVGKPRSGAYNLIGQEGGVDDLADEACWGGVASTNNTDEAKARVSYLVKKVTAADTDTDGYYYAAHLTGKGSSANNPVSLKFDVDSINMSNYGNGFRGIGASYTFSANLWSASSISLTKNYRRALLVSGINVDKERATTITLNMSQRAYHPGGQNTDFEKGFWNQGVGLFTAFSYTSGAQVKNLTLSGTVCLNTFAPSTGKLSRVYKSIYDFCVGGFAGLISNSSGTVTFTNLSLEELNVYGGTTTGGVFGITSGSSLAFPSFHISNVNVVKTVTDDGSIGGLVGLKRGHVTIGNKDNPSSIQNLTVKMFGTKTKTQSCGGLIGCSDGGNLTIQNIQADNLTVSGEDTRDVGGLVSGFRQNGTLTISDCTLTDLTVTYKANADGNNGEHERNVGGLVGYVNQNVGSISKVHIVSSQMSATSGNSLGGFVGYTQRAITMDDCHISGSLYLSGRSQPYLGGFIGRSSTGGTITIKNCTEENLNILSGDNDAGGLVGKMTNGTTNASNVTFTNVIVATKKNDKSVGLLTGHTNGKTINGYNILANSCTVGYNTKATIDDLGTITSTGTYNGLWLGGSKDKDNKLVAVAVTGTNQPQKDIGKIESGSVQVTYADYPAAQTNTSSSAPYVDVNPGSGVTVTDGKTTTTLTGNAIGMSGGKSVAQTILEESSSTASGRRYQNLSDCSAMLNKENPLYLSTFHAEEGTGSGPSENFPVLVVNTNVNTVVNTQLWDFIAAMTNVSSGAAAKAQVSAVTVGTYKWNGSSFGKQTNASLTYTDGGNFRTNGRYDNTLAQITVVDVQYNDPTGGGKVFHLYVPIMMRKLMNVTVELGILEGTNYYAADYANLNSAQGKTYATAGFGENITALITYNYERSLADWQTSLDEGENLLWSYKKQIDLYSEGTKLPAGTKLTLLNRHTCQVYHYTLTGSESQKPLDMNAVFGMESFPVCDLLDITATESNENGKYVRTDASNATVRISDGSDYAYYRPKTDTDSGDFYSLAVGENVVGTNNYLAQGEMYYLTICVPPTAGTPLVNHLMAYSGSSLTAADGTLAPPTKIVSRPTYRYVIYDGVDQELSISTRRFSGGNHPAGDASTSMANGDSIEITMETQLSLQADESVKQSFKDYAPKELYHQFAVNLKKYNATDSGTAVAIGATSALIRSSICIGDEVKTSKEEKVLLNGEECLTITCGGAELPGHILSADAAGKPLTVKAVITLYYDDISGQGFPSRDDENDTSGIGITVESRFADQQNTLAITNNRKTKDSEERYYTEAVSFASLVYDIQQNEEGTGRGDTNAQLGINANDPDENSLYVFTVGTYQYPNLSDTVLSQAKEIGYKLELFQKQGNGSYRSSALNLGTYWTELNVNTGDVALGSILTPYEYVTGFTPDNSKLCTVPIRFSVLTGAEFEAKGLKYANYMVRLSAVLLDASGTAIPGTEASDFIIYTNARVYSQVMPSSGT